MVRYINNLLESALLNFIYKNLEVSFLPPTCPQTFRRSFYRSHSHDITWASNDRSGVLATAGAGAFVWRPWAEPRHKSSRSSPLSIFFHHNLGKIGWQGKEGCQLAGRFFLPCSKVSNYSHGYEADISFLQSSLGKSRSACGPFLF